DVQAYPWSADWYRTQATAALGGPDELEDSFRLWYMDNADHDRPASVEAGAHIVSYAPEVQQALLDLDAWVLNGTPPPASSTYSVSDDTQVSLATTASERGGVQPVVSLVASAGDECGDGTARVEVGAGDEVAFDLTAEMPSGTGDIVRVEWDFDGTGAFPDGGDLDEASTQVDQCETHTYDEPGTYFAVARVTAQRDGDGSASFGLIQNLARVRVVVG
ncbi:MAG TPA: PKD domain-containing protein, partial [Acidimicrobiales bacterium]